MIIVVAKTTTGIKFAHGWACKYTRIVKVVALAGIISYVYATFLSLFGYTRTRVLGMEGPVLGIARSRADRRLHWSSMATVEPIPGKCGAKCMSKTWRERAKHLGVDVLYCEGEPIPDGNGRCRHHAGKSLVGPALPNYTHGNTSKYRNIIPKSLRRHLDLVSVKEVASCRDEISLVDARTSQILEEVDKKNPVALTRTARENLVLLTEAIDENNLRAAARHAEEIASFLESQERMDKAWSEIRKNLATRDQLARTELQYQKLLSDRVLLEHMDAFMQALIQEARELTDDKKKLSAYVLRVLEMTRGITGTYPAGFLKSKNDDIVDGETVEGSDASG